MKKIFSIITVCYNSEKTISKTFDSLLNQEFTDFEYIIVDGKSTDRTVDIINEYDKKFKDKGIEFKWVSEPDSGIYDAMNKGIRMSSGDIIGIINSDDRYFDKTLMYVFNAVKENPEYDIYHGLCKFVNNDKIKMIRAMSSENLNNSMIEHPACFVKKECYNEIGLFDTDYKYVADYDFMIRAKKNKKKFFMIEEILAQFDENGAGNSKKSRKELIKLQFRYKLYSPFKLLLKYIRIIIKRERS